MRTKNTIKSHSYLTIRGGELDSRVIHLILAFISMLSLIATYSIASDSAEDLNRNVFFSVTDGATNAITIFLIKLQNTYHSDSIVPIVLLIALFQFYESNACSIKKNKEAMLLAILFAICFLLGKSYVNYGDSSLLTQGKFQMFFAGLSLLGLTALFFHIISFLQNLIAQSSLQVCSSHQKDGKERNWKSYVLLILLAWSPFLIAYFPGCIPWDTMIQLRAYTGIDALTNHYPILSTFLMGWSYSLGKILGMNIGIFVYILFQMILGAFVCGMVCKKLSEWNIPLTLIRLTAAFYAFLPIWASAYASSMKDYLYVPIFSLFLILYMERVLSGTWTAKTGLLYILLALLLTLIRSEGIYIILVATFGLTVSMQSWRKKLYALLLCILFFVGYRLYQQKLDDMGLNSAFDKREAYSVVFQCTANYVRLWDEELTEQEKQVIDLVLDYEQIKNNYVLGNADFSKDTYKCPDISAWNAYKKLWFKSMGRHPGAYFDAMLTCAAGYLLPGYNYPTKEVYFLYTREYEGDLNVGFVFSREVRSVFESYVNIWKNGPITSLFFSAGTYTWVLLWSIWNLLRKRGYKLCIGLLPPLLVLGVCCISPITGLLRYALPYIAVTPLLISYSIKANEMSV